MPTAIKVNEEKKVNIIMVAFETSTSPNWKDIKIFIKGYFFLTLTQLKVFYLLKTNYKFRRIKLPNIIL